jgi:2-dehydropantoate 2-reductase
MEIEKASLIGLGALGIMVGKKLLDAMDGANFKIVADEERIKRYARDGIYANGVRCDFSYAKPDDLGERDDLILFAVKFGGLDAAIDAVKNRVGPETILVSMLNGISSEGIIALRYGWDKVICCVMQGTDALKVGNRMTYSNPGVLCIGDCERGPASERVRRVKRLFDRSGVPCETDENMQRRMWGKWMLNVGLNQTLAVRGGSYRDIQREGETRDAMIAAMREVITLAQKAEIELHESDLPYWLDMQMKLDPESKPSMLQDVEAKRKTEVELFSGTVRKMGRECGVPTPVNDALYERILSMEAAYDKS